MGVALINLMLLIESYSLKVEMRHMYEVHKVCFARRIHMNSTESDIVFNVKIGCRVSNHYK